jgi:ABC-type sugar transport system ATPase subunit
MKAIDKLFPGVRALDKVDFCVKRGEVNCLIGANGAGKSTLMKILSGAYVEDGGKIIFDGKELRPHGTLERKKQGISVIYQELSLINELDVGENVFINNYPRNKAGLVNWNEVYKKTQEIADQLNLRINVKAKIKSLNIGQRQLTEIMKALASNAKLIVMDEPSSTLSKSEFETLLRVIEDLKKAGITIIYISHHLEELFIVGDRITVLRDGKFVVCKLVNELNEDMLVEYMTGARLSQLHKEESDVNPISDQVVMEMKNMSNHKVSGINFKLHKGEVLGFYGLVGSGRTEILRSIFGVDPYTGGEILINGKKVCFKSTKDAIRHKIGLVPENRKTQGLILILPVWENMSMVALKRFIRRGFIHYRSIDETCHDYKKKLNIKTPTIKTVTQNLSGGNQQKVVLAKWLAQDCDILLIDEPTQGIDVMAKEEIYKIIRMLSEQGKSIIVVSSELEELLRICDNISVMYDGRQVMASSKANFNQDRILQVSVTGGIHDEKN